MMSGYETVSVGLTVWPRSWINLGASWLNLPCILIAGSYCECGEGNGNPLQYSCLENPMDREAWWAAVHGVVKSRTQPNDFTFTFHFHALEKEMAAHSSVPAWRISGMAEPGGLPSMGSHRVGHDWSDLAALWMCVNRWHRSLPLRHTNQNPKCPSDTGSVTSFHIQLALYKRREIKNFKYKKKNNALLK